MVVFLTEHFKISGLAKCNILLSNKQFISFQPGSICMATSAGVIRLWFAYHRAPVAGC